jgi:hypothetical protein
MKRDLDAFSGDRSEAIALRNPLFVKQTLALIEAQRVSVLSLDVFDTLVWRFAEKPSDVFGHVGRRLFEAGLLSAATGAMPFQELRRVAESRARERARRDAGSSEVSLEEIYRELGPVVTNAAGALQVELETERDFVRFDPLVAELARLAAARRVQLLLCSDTYFSPAQLAFLVRATETPWLAAAWVATSSERRLCKADGLIARVLSERGVERERVLHIGDNHQADVAGMNRIGIRNLHYPRLADRFGAEHAVERELVSWARAATAAADGPAACPHSISALRKVVDADLRFGGDQASPAYVSALMSFGPLLTGFVEWVVEQAQAEGASHVFCLTREGVFLSELVNCYAQARAKGLRATPLLVSRSALFPGVFHEGSREEIEDFLFRRRTPFTLSKLFGLIGLPADEAQALEIDLHQPLRRGHPDTEKVIHWLACNPVIAERLRSFGAASRSRASRYVTSVFAAAAYDPAQSSCVFVDLGWSAFSQLLLERLIAEPFARPRPPGLYLGTTPLAIESRLRGVRARGWLCESGDPVLVDRVFLSTKEIIEQACAAEIGSVLGYDDEAEPILEPSSIAPGQKFALQTIRNVVRKVLACYLRDWPLWTDAGRHRWSEAREAMAGLLGRVNSRPSKEEARLFLGFAHDENNLSGGTEKLGGAYHRALVEYATASQIADSSVYWPFGIASAYRPCLLLELAHRKLGESVDQHTRRIDGRLELKIGATATSVDSPLYVSADGRGVAYAAFFARSGWELAWVNRGEGLLSLERTALSIWEPETNERRELLVDVSSDALQGGTLSGSRRLLAPDERLVLRGEAILPPGHAREIGLLLCFALA